METESILITNLNMNKICRVCLLENDRMFSIYSELCEDNSDEEIPCIYEILVGISSIKIQPDDGLPSMICTSCIDNAHVSFKFQRQCNQSQVILDTYISQFGDIACVQDVGDTMASDDLGLDHINETELVKETEENISVPSCYVLLDDNYREDGETDEDNVSNGECDSKLDIEESSLNNGNRQVCEAVKVEKIESITPNCDNLKDENMINEKIHDTKSDNVDGKSADFQSVKYYCKQTADGIKVYACNLCPKIYKYGSSLRIHMRNHTQERPYSCTECGKEFKQYGSLIYHQRSHSGEQPYACKICGKKYKQSGTLTAHMRVHTGQKPFLCSICGRGFRQAPDLGYHMRTHTKEKPYMCNVCGKTMSMQCHLVQHMRTHTGERPFKCTSCDKAFPSSTRLKRHAIIHTGLKPYVCEVCDKSFNRSSSLRVHSKIHTDERPHVCPICNKGFIQAHALKAHIVTHSSELSSMKQLVV